jgi:hypothetical protein
VLLCSNFRSGLNSVSAWKLFMLQPLQSPGSSLLKTYCSNTRQDINFRNEMERAPTRRFLFLDSLSIMPNLPQAPLWMCPYWTGEHIM